ncbi:MAG TPA: nucleotide exchange factor GrpE [Candidatus Kapabacteria bacterium]|nr:nucleotide exchange factor GrpE [Candidatus Kapabacteria bacterium]
MTDEEIKQPEEGPSCVKCQEKEKLCEEYSSKWLRAVADYQNLQKEVERQRGDWVKMSEAQILLDFLPVYDNFKKAFAHGQGEVTKEQENWIKGIGYIMKQFGDVLKSYRIEEVRTVGEAFDPTKHETVGEEEGSGKEAGTIVREVEGGYMKDGKILKTAKVILAT